MTLQQSPNDGAVSVSDGRYPPAYNHHPSPVMLQGAPPPPQVTGYMVAGPSGGHPAVLQGQHIPTLNPTYPGSSAGPAPFPSLLQQPAYIQQPVQQVGPVQSATRSSVTIL